MNTAAYTLKKKKETGELHLFKGSFKDNGCTSADISICNKMKKEESEGNRFQCKNEDEARTLCASIGRQVCGICVSDLYETYE